MLMGLLIKTAILITELASSKRDNEGKSISEAAYEAAKERLRPILMTSMTMVIGMIPLALATGVGSNGNKSLGLGIVGGMSIGIIGLLFMVPVFFILFKKIEEYFKALRPSNSIDKLEDVES
ncbi:efflux RND transporter permease subunit [Halosquirtibacter xylanolyticus]|nr:efflux RND transporter permease subunit [Prolixibacteraceae bacterium]